MNYFLRYPAINLFSVLCIAVLLMPRAFACSKMMRWNDDPPYTFISPSEPELVQGISIDIARAVLASLNCELKLTKMPWARALASLKVGDVDLISGAFNIPERQEYAYFSSIAEYSENVLFLRKNEEKKWKLRSLADISTSQFKLGAQINVTYSQEFNLLTQQDAFSERLYFNSSRESLWQMLSLKRIDGVIADRKTGLIELKNLSLKGRIMPSSLIVSREPSFFAFSKKTTSKSFVTQFDKVFLTLMSEGKITAIENSYTY